MRCQKEESPTGRRSRDTQEKYLCIRGSESIVGDGLWLKKKRKGRTRQV